MSMLAMGLAAGAYAQDEARLLRFPATNGTDVVFSYAGDLYSAPLSGGEALAILLTENILPLPASMTVTVRSILSRRKAGSRAA